MEYSREETLLKEKLSGAERVLIGIGREWTAEGGLLKEENQRVKLAYDALHGMVRDKDYFLVTTLTDGSVYETRFDRERITAPCGNVHWRQCQEACTKDIWEEGEVPDGVCPHCGAPLTGNTIAAKNYIEEGYLPAWKRYQLWLSSTLNRELTVLELGEGFLTPTVIRWPFEKTVFFNRKSWMFRINREFFQTAAQIKERSTPIACDSVDFIKEYNRE